MLRVKGRPRIHGQIEGCQQEASKGTNNQKGLGEGHGSIRLCLLLLSNLHIYCDVTRPGICDAQLWQLQLLFYQCGQGVEVGNTGLE